MPPLRYTKSLHIIHRYHTFRHRLEYSCQTTLHTTQRQGIIAIHLNLIEHTVTSLAYINAPTWTIAFGTAEIASHSLWGNIFFIIGNTREEQSRTIFP